VVSRDDVVRGGCRHFLRHATIDMDALAGDLSISRATLYRVVHSRDGLLGDVLWRLAKRMLDDARRERTATGSWRRRGKFSSRRRAATSGG
jgi:hypothetical protein